MSLPFGGDSTPGFRRRPGDTTSDDRGGGGIFATITPGRCRRVSVARWTGIHEPLAVCGHGARGKLSSGNRKRSTVEE